MDKNKEKTNPETERSNKTTETRDVEHGNQNVGDNCSKKEAWINAYVAKSEKNISGFKFQLYKVWKTETPENQN